MRRVTKAPVVPMRLYDKGKARLSKGGYTGEEILTMKHKDIIKPLVQFKECSARTDRH